MVHDVRFEDDNTVFPFHTPILTLSLPNATLKKQDLPLLGQPLYLYRLTVDCYSMK